jgi:hypothetical protein
VPIEKKTVLLPADDRIRMTRLYEEVFTRLEEMAMITARAIKLEAGATCAVKFNPLTEHGDSEFATVEIVSTEEYRGCYDYRTGACFGTEILNASRKN